MKSTEVYSLLRSKLAPWFKAGGFGRAKGFLSWSPPHGDRHIVVWFQISRDGWDAFAGSKFVVEFQRSVEPLVGARADRRQRLGALLSAEQREQVRMTNNAVIGSLKRPTPGYAKLQISPEVTKWYLAQFQPRLEPHLERDDIWLHYASPEDVVRWAGLIETMLPGFIEAIGGEG